MIPDLRSSRGESTTSEIGFYPGHLHRLLSHVDHFLYIILLYTTAVFKVFVESLPPASASSERRCH